jgi:hypothetical protein
MPVTVAERSKASTDFARSEAGIVGSNPTQGIDVWCVYMFILCLGRGLATNRSPVQRVLLKRSVSRMPYAQRERQEYKKMINIILKCT